LEVLGLCGRIILKGILENETGGLGLDQCVSGKLQLASAIGTVSNLGFP
jgi:hypothetical protein